MISTIRDWETIFARWAAPPSQSEQDRCENSARAIREAIAADSALNRRNISVFVQGSYRNNVNVRQESDVDIGVLCRDTFYFDLPSGYSREHFGLDTPASYEYSQFKNEVGRALLNRFGSAAVQRGDKAFDVHANSYRVEADVAPFFEFRRYRQDGRYHEGVKLVSDRGQVVVNWPEQHYRNGVSKNEATRRSFKGCVRILKRLAIDMAEASAAKQNRWPSFLIECLCYNVPNVAFGEPTWRGTVRAVLANIYNGTLDDQRCADWLEVSELKWLFRGNPAWTRLEAHAFADAAWNYLGLE